MFLHYAIMSKMLSISYAVYCPKYYPKEIFIILTEFFSRDLKKRENNIRGKKPTNKSTYDDDVFC